MNIPYKSVISKFRDHTDSTANTAKVLQYLEGLNHDNMGIAFRGPLGERILKDVVPEARKIVRMSCKKYPKLLSDLEIKYLDRVEWPKSQYSVRVYKETLKTWSNAKLYPTWWEDKLVAFKSLEAYADWWKTQGLKLPFFQSRRFEFDTTGRDLSKGAGLPKMGPKRINLGPAVQYANRIKADPTTPAWMILCGRRTQQAKPGVTKSRPILGDPESEWVIEIEAYADAINQASEHAKQDSGKKDVQLGYAPPEVIQKYIFDREWNMAVVLDYTQYGASITAQELQSHLRWFAGDYPAGIVDHIIDHNCRCPFIGPGPELISKIAGGPDGKITTNLIDSSTNMVETDHNITDQKLDRYCIGWLVNGDDIAMLFKTAISDVNLEKLAAKSTRTLNVDKVVRDTDGVWFSKVAYFEKYYCKPIMLVLNSTIFREHEADPLTGTAAYTAVALAQQVEWLKFHPDGEKVARLIKKEDKHPIETIPDEQRKEAEKLYVSKHNWMEDAGQDEAVAQLSTGFYASL